jgi:hypothetical protein
MKRLNKFKKVNNLRINLNIDQFYNILEYVSTYHYYIKEIAEESKRIDESNFEEVQSLTKNLEEHLESDLYKHIPQRFMDYNWEDATSEANRVEEAWTAECVAEQKALERWYYSTRL